MARILDLSGAVTIDGRPYELSLQIRQQSAAERYSLHVEGPADVTLGVHPPAGGRQELELRFQRVGMAKGRTGHLMVNAP